MHHKQSELCQLHLTICYWVGDCDSTIRHASVHHGTMSRTQDTPETGSEYEVPGPMACNVA